MKGTTLLLSACVLLGQHLTLNAAEVSTEKLPKSACRPQVAVDRSGNVHMVYADLNKRGDLFYTKKVPGQRDFTPPIQVNSTPNCAAGFNMTLGRKGRVHVLIRPNARYSQHKLQRTPKIVDLKYMLYCRLNDHGTKFEAERDLSDTTFAFEGVGAVIADGRGRVAAFWHGLEEPGPEHTRGIFVTRSTDDGRTFTKPKRVEHEVVGACACCSMAGAMGADGKLYLAFRNSEPTANKDSYLLSSDDNGASFTGVLLEPWANAGCPGSVYSLIRGPSDVFVAWDTRGQIKFAKSGALTNAAAAPTAGKKTRAPILVINSLGEVLMAWAEADEPRQFMKGGDLAWQVYDQDGRPLSEKRVLPGGVGPRWSTPSAYAKPNGDFVVFYNEPSPVED